MFTRFFRLLDRSSRLVVKLTSWMGSRLVLSYLQLVQVLRARLGGAALDTEATRVESQVQSLSGLTVILLASVVALIFWATSTSARNNAAAPGLGISATNTPQSASDAQASPTPPADFSTLRATGTIVFSMLVGVQEDLFAVAADQPGPVRLTNDPADDRDPAWSPDGQRIAFASHRNGSWDLYLLDMPTGEVTRLTDDPAFESNPTWSPDGLWLAYEGYYSGNLNIYIVKIDGTEGPYPLTQSPAPDFAPAWITVEPGRTIAYVSWREGNQDIYLISLDKPDENLAVNLTHTSDINESDPAWSPDASRIAYSTVEDGFSLIYTKPADNPDAMPTLVDQGHSPAWSPNGSSLVFFADRDLEGTGHSLLLTGELGSWETSFAPFSLPGLADSPHWTPAGLPPVMQGSLAFASTDPLPGPLMEPLIAGAGSPGTVYQLVTLQDYGVAAEFAFLSDRVDGSFLALRDHVNQAAGWDFLGRLDSVFWELDRPLEPGQDLQNWHKAGRAVDVIQAYNQGGPAQIEVVPERVGPNMYWRLYVRADVQDGSLGEPLRSQPWDFYSRFSGDMAAYEAGGRLRDGTPLGYYVDFTRIAQMYGWVRTPAKSSWRYNWPGILYWQYVKTDGLDWRSAMLEIYPEASLERALITATSGPPAAQTPALSLTPGITGTPVITTTAAAPSAVGTPSALPTPTRPSGADHD